MEETAGGYPAFAALPATYTEKEKEQQSASRQPPTDPHGTWPKPAYHQHW